MAGGLWDTHPHPNPTAHVGSVSTCEASPGSASGSGHRPGAGPREQSWMTGGPNGCPLSMHRASGMGGGRRKHKPSGVESQFTFTATSPEDIPLTAQAAEALRGGVAGSPSTASKAQSRRKAACLGSPVPFPVTAEASMGISQVSTHWV